VCEKNIFYEWERREGEGKRGRREGEKGREGRVIRRMSPIRPSREIGQVNKSKSNKLIHCLGYASLKNQY
jgi:hypothetical protein